MNFLGPGPLAAPTPEVGSVGPEAARKDLPPASRRSHLALGPPARPRQEIGLAAHATNLTPCGATWIFLHALGDEPNQPPAAASPSARPWGMSSTGSPTPCRCHRPMPERAVSHPGHPGLRPRVHETPQDAEPTWHHAASKQGHGVSCTAPAVRNEPVRVASAVKSDDRWPRAKAGTTRDRNGPGFSGLISGVRCCG